MSNAITGGQQEQKKAVCSPSNCSDRRRTYFIVSPGMESEMWLGDISMHQSPGLRCWTEYIITWGLTIRMERIVSVWDYQYQQVYKSFFFRGVNPFGEEKGIFCSTTLEDKQKDWSFMISTSASFRKSLTSVNFKFNYGFQWPYTIFETSSSCIYFPLILSLRIASHSGIRKLNEARRAMANLSVFFRCLCPPST